MDYYIIADEKFLAFEWGRTFDAYLHECARKRNIALKPLDVSNPPAEGYLFLLGVDSVWLAETAEKIAHTHLIAILLEGGGAVLKNRTVHITNDQHSVITESVNLLQAKGCKAPAFFGVQKNDTSDMKKAERFSAYYGEKNIYYVSDDIYEAYDRFCSDIARYDSVICSNDLFAVFLMKKFAGMGMDVPAEMKVIGNGNLWISSHIKPSLTTACNCDYYKTANIIFSLLRSEALPDVLSNMDLSLKNTIVPRETTGDAASGDERHLYFVSERNSLDYARVKCPELKVIVKLNRVLSSLPETDREVLRCIVRSYSREEISGKCFLSYDSVKYHIKKIYGALGVHNKGELISLLRDNLIDTDKL